MSIHLSQTYKPRYNVDMTLDYFGKNNMTGKTSTIILAFKIVYDNIQTFIGIRDAWIVKLAR